MGWSLGRATFHCGVEWVPEDVAGESDAATEGDGFGVDEPGEVGELDAESGGGGCEDVAGGVGRFRGPPTPTATTPRGASFADLIKDGGDDSRVPAGPGGGDGSAGQHLSGGIEDSGAGLGSAEVDDDIDACRLGSAGPASRLVG